MSTTDREIHYDNRFRLQKWDVVGEWDDNHKKISDGLVVARSEERCPIFGDIVPYKSLTIVCKEDELGDALYWLSYVHGGGHSREKKLNDGRIAIRSDYQAW